MNRADVREVEPQSHAVDGCATVNSLQLWTPLKQGSQHKATGAERSRYSAAVNSVSYQIWDGGCFRACKVDQTFTNRGFRQVARQRAWAGGTGLAIGPPLTEGREVDAVHRVRVGRGHRAARAHRARLQALSLPRVREAVERAHRDGAEPGAVPVRRDR